MRGTIKRIMDEKRFGFIQGEDGKEYFFHSSEFQGYYDDLVEDVKKKQRVPVEFAVMASPKGPRAGNVIRTDGGVGEIDFSQTTNSE
jgi:cold shock CspA family protein